MCMADLETKAYFTTRWAEKFVGWYVYGATSTKSILFLVSPKLQKSSVGEETGLLRVGSYPGWSKSLLKKRRN